MVNRLRLSLNSGSPILKLSKPGFDVDTATETNLLFNIGTAGYSGVLLSGIVPFSSFAVSTASNFYGFSNYYRYEIALGRTFAVAPKIAVSVNDAILGSSWFGPKYAPSNVSFDNIGGTGLHGNEVKIGAESFVDKIALYMQRTYYDGSAYPYPANMSYVAYLT